MSGSSGKWGSSGSSSVCGSIFARNGGRRCKYRRPTIVYTSKTHRNPNRAFHRCPNFKWRKPYCDFFRWVVDASNERMELEEGSINKLELDVVEMEFKLKYVDMKLSGQLQVKLNEQEGKMKDLERKIKELSVKMVSELDRMEKEYTHVCRSARVLGATIVGLVIICIYIGSRGI